jgi:hypothetical protein
VEALLRPQNVASVGPGLDFAADPLPVRLVRVVPLKEHLEAKAKRGIPDLLLAQHVDAPVDVFPRDGRLELLETHEILLVERAQTVDGHLQLAN